MYIQYLIEDESGKELINAFMEKYIMENPCAEIEYYTHSYKGIGGFRKGHDARNIKSQHLLDDLPKRLKAFNEKLRYINNSVLFIVVDNDEKDTVAFREQLIQIVKRERIVVDHVFCIAVEEMEAWLLGDREAIKTAYPELSDRIDTKHPNYKQDNICGTWEFLADMLTPRGFGQFKKRNPTFHDVGKRKAEWARNIGRYLSIRDNASPSFQYMLSELDLRLPEVC